MSEYLVYISSIAELMFSVLTSIFNLYTGTAVLCGVFALWVVRRIFKLFHLL